MSTVVYILNKLPSRLLGFQSLFEKLLCNTRLDIQKKFKMKDLGELKFFLGIELSMSNQGILMSQRKYALKLISESGLGGAKPACTPL